MNTKKYFYLITCLFFTFYCLNVNSAGSAISDKSVKNDYSFELSDENMKKISSGMITWCFIFITVTILSAFIHTDAGAPVPPVPPVKPII